MFSIALAAILAVQPLPANANTDVVVPPVSAIVRSAATAADHIDSARRALASGAFDVARREYVIAVALDRDAGRLPVEASFGLAHVLYSQSYTREAAITLDRLASEAGRLGDIETEAKALCDAIWLQLDAGQRLVARANAARLRSISTDPRLSAETRKLIKSRIS